jgi:hypothetical protein
MPCPTIPQHQHQRRAPLTPLLQIPLQPGETFQSAAQPALKQALDGLQAAAQSVHLAARVTHTAAFPGCVHVLMDVVLLPDAATADGQQLGTGRGTAAHDGRCHAAPELSPAMAQALAAALEAHAAEDGRQILAAVVPAVPEEVEPAFWLDLPWAALLSPVCLTTAEEGEEVAGSGRQSARVGLLPGSTSQLPAQPRAVVTGHVVTGAGVESVCEVVEQTHIWAPAAAEGRRVLSVSGLPATATPAVLSLHVLPGPVAAAAAAGDGPAVVHPLASLPLLCLPEAAAEEVLQLFAGMVQENIEAAAAGDSSAAGDELTAARQAYWRHFVPFASSWRSLLLAAAAMQEPGCAAAAVPDRYEAVGGTAGMACSPAATPASLPDLLEDATELVTFLASHGLLACLELAAALLFSVGLAAGPLQPPAAEAAPEVAAEVATTQEQQQQQQQSSSTQQDQEQQQEGAAVSGAERQGRVSNEPGSKAPAAPHATSAAQEALPSSKPGSKGGHKAGSPAADQLDVPAQPCWRHLLHGFPQPATEAAYLAFKNRRCLAQDGAAAALCFAIIAVGATVTTLNNAVSAGLLMIHTGSLLFVMPWLVMLVSKHWYLQHREPLLVGFGGAARLLFCLPLGVSSLLTGVDQCFMLPNCMLMMTSGPMMQYPITQQVRLFRALPGLLMDSVGVACYAAFTLGCPVKGAAVGVATAAVGMGVTAALDWKCRVLFCRARQ